MSVVKRLIWMLLGYGVAVVAATFATIAMVILASAFPDQGQFGSVYKIVPDMLALSSVGLAVTSVYAFPGWLIAAIIAERTSQTGRVFFIFAGVLTSLLAHLMFSGFGAWEPVYRMSGEMRLIILWSMIGGAFGGMAYWSVTVKLFERWNASR